MSGPFNCPKCGAHDYGLYQPALGGECPHCMKQLLAEHKTLMETYKSELSACQWGREQAEVALEKERTHVNELYAAIGFSKERCEQNGDSPFDCIRALRGAQNAEGQVSISPGDASQSALDASQPAPSAPAPAAPICSECKGAGTVVAQTTHLGPDDYTYDAECPSCGGAGVATAPAAPLVERLRVLADYAPDPDMDYGGILREAAAALEAAQRDARRYRWLRENQDSACVWGEPSTSQGDVLLQGEQLDAAIDAAQDSERMSAGLNAALEATKEAVRK